MSSVNAVSPKQDNSSRNGLIAGSVGIVGGGAAGYATKSILKDGNYTDEFVSSFYKNNKDYKQLLAFLSLDKNAPTFGEDLSKILSSLLKDVGEIPPELPAPCYYDQLVGALKEVYGNDLTTGKNTNFHELYKKFIYKQFDVVFDRTKKAFKSNIPEESQYLIESVKTVMSNLKLKAGAIYGGVAAAVLGIGAYVYTKMTNK